MTRERAGSSRVERVARGGSGERSGVNDQGAPGEARPTNDEAAPATRSEPPVSLLTAVAALLAGLAPCPACGVRPAGAPGVCGPCRALLLAATAAQTEKPGDVVWLGPYAGTWLRLVHALKYRGARRLAGFLGELLAVRVARAGWCSGAGAIDLIAHVPTTAARARERGFDQAELLAAAVAAHLGVRRVRALRRVRATAKLSARGRSERAALLTGALEARYLPNRSVLLVDDVLTTGATLESASKALLDSGAAGVRCAVVARTMRRSV
ncbi:MAG: hypothetical protein M9914_02005 [Trueperaceae bacterium]|nr:hypothetical protein [Trueperaceae bacterium]